MLWAWTLPVRLLFMFALSLVFVFTAMLSWIFLLKPENPLTYWMYSQWWCIPAHLDTYWDKERWEERKDTWISK